MFKTNKLDYIKIKNALLPHDWTDLKRCLKNKKMLKRYKAFKKFKKTLLWTSFVTYLLPQINSLLPIQNASISQPQTTKAPTSPSSLPPLTGPPPPDLRPSSVAFLTFSCSFSFSYRGRAYPVVVGWSVLLLARSATDPASIHLPPLLPSFLTRAMEPHSIRVEPPAAGQRCREQ